MEPSPSSTGIASRRTGRDRLGILVLLLLIATVAPATASSGGDLVPPQRIVLYVHADLKSTGFIDPLICALARVLRAPVEARALDLPIDAALFSSPNQLDAGALAVKFHAATRHDAGGAFRYLLLPNDVRFGRLRYAFAMSFPLPFNIGVVSTARIDGTDPARPGFSGADLTAERAYKLILKSAARLTGYLHSNGCVLGFPRDLAELDRKSPEFCPDDRKALVRAGLLKPVEGGGGCVPIVQTVPPVPFSLVADRQPASARNPQRRPHRQAPPAG